MVLSSPAGSTGHNASIGGAILYPSLEILQLTPLAPIHSNTYHSLRNPLIIPQNSKVRLMPEPRYANHSILVVDGAEKKQKDLKYIDFFIRRSECAAGVRWSCPRRCGRTTSCSTVNLPRHSGRWPTTSPASGRLADLCLVRLDIPEMTPCHNFISNLVYSANGSAVDTTIIDGKILMRAVDRKSVV